MYHSFSICREGHDLSAVSRPIASEKELILPVCPSPDRSEAAMRSSVWSCGPDKLPEHAGEPKS